jgi:hypothetical protein
VSTNRLSHSRSPQRLRLHRFLAVALATSAIAHAQPNQSPSADASFRFSARSDAGFAGATHGELETSSVAFSTETSRAFSEKLRLKLGLNYQEVFVNATNALPVPDSLRSVKVDLGAIWNFSSQLSASLIARPGISSDGESFDGDGFHIPAMLLVRWQVNRAVTLFGGTMYDSFSEDAFTPLFGLRWQGTPRVALTLGAPRTEISYELRKGHKLFVAASFQGGNFHMDDPAVIPPAGYPGLRDTEVSYREIFLGAGYAWPLTENLSAEIEAGWMADRRFDYNDRGLVVKTDGASTVRFSVNARF